MSARQGPLAGVTVVEFASLGPVPFAGMILSDLGATVITLDRHDSGTGNRVRSVMSRGRRSVAIDLKHPESTDVVLALVDSADVLMEGLRPGVMERLGLGPAPCLRRNPRLVYARMTGFGQDGPLASAPGHDINFIALAGVLGAIGREGAPPTPPLNLIGDYGGGGMLLVVGVLSALLHSRMTGEGQVIDAAMLDGAVSLMASAFAQLEPSGPRGTNVLDGGAPFYGAYETSDGKYVAVGAVEPQFYRALLEGLSLGNVELPPQWQRGGWPELKSRFARVFATRTRDEWCEALEGTDACLSPVLEVSEVPGHAQNLARTTFVKCSGVTQPAPAPRFSVSQPGIQGNPPRVGEHTDDVLLKAGFTPDEVCALREGGSIS